MKSKGTVRFWSLYQALPFAIRELARKNYHIWKTNPHHPSLRFRRVQGRVDLFTVRVWSDYRALGQLVNDQITWVWIGTHAEYDRLLS